MLARSTLPLSVTLVGLLLVGLPACMKDDTYVELRVDLRDSESPPDIRQLQVDVERQSDGDVATLLFPPNPAPGPLEFPATAVIILPPEAGAFNIRVLALDDNGNVVPDTVEAHATGVAVRPEGKTNASVLIDIQLPVVGLYAACTENSDCENGLQCAGVGVLTDAPNQFCTFQQCDAANEGADPQCNAPNGGPPGRCFDLGVVLCLPTCAGHDDCGPGQGCNMTNGACFSACTGDADCQKGFVCDPNPDAPKDRRLCVSPP